MKKKKFKTNSEGLQRCASKNGQRTFSTKIGFMLLEYGPVLGTATPATNELE